MRRRKREDQNMPLMEHIHALRRVLVYAALGIALGTIIGWVYSDQVFRYLAQPAVNLQGVNFITTTPMEPVMVKLKISLVVGIAIALPIIVWQLWSFILPALKQNERKYLYIIMPSSLLLLIGGAAFAYYLVVPMGMKFLLYIGIESVQTTAFLTKTSYLSFILSFIITFGLVFQMPVVLLLLIRLGLISPKTLAKKRKWAFFGIVVAAMLVSPTPDLMTQGLMVVPMYLLYEISIWLGYLVVRNREKALQQ